jgi:hypothetical protein
MPFVVDGGPFGKIIAVIVFVVCMRDCLALVHNTGLVVSVNGDRITSGMIRVILMRAKHLKV